MVILTYIPQFFASWHSKNRIFTYTLQFFASEWLKSRNFSNCKYLSSRGVVILAYMLIFYTSQQAKICIWFIHILKSCNNVAYQLHFCHSSCCLVSLGSLQTTSHMP